jgi:predicted Fe-Mo cluster-binding NifX family protein
MNRNPITIAVPLQGEQVSGHFGHPECFCMVAVDPSSREILGEVRRVPPPHEPGRLPVWLAEQGVQVVLASGIGHRAVSLLESRGIEVLSGVPQRPTSEVVQLWLDGLLPAGTNTCGHGSGEHRCGGHHPGGHDSR